MMMLCSNGVSYEVFFYELGLQMRDMLRKDVGANREPCRLDNNGLTGTDIAGLHPPFTTQSHHQDGTTQSKKKQQQLEGQNQTITSSHTLHFFPS
jgi:hypothetical protein